MNFSIWDGSVLLENLEIKSSIFDAMPVPYILHYGKVGRIFIDLPSMINLMSGPLTIEISDVFIFIKPKGLDQWRDDVEIKAYIDNTESLLESLEV